MLETTIGPKNELMRINEFTVKPLTRKSPSHANYINGKTVVELRTRDLEVALTNSKYLRENRL